MKINRVDYLNDNTPILYDREIDEYAHAVLADYRPQLLQEPGAIRFEHFLEYYLGVTLLFKDIHNDEEDTKQIFGATVFRGGILKTHDRENDCIKNMIVRENTVIIDNYVMEKGREGLALFTGLHEAGHFLIHQSVYDAKTKRSGNKSPAIVYCRRDTVENFGGSRKERTAKDWIEHQADYFAASFAMPNKTFIPLVNEFLREHGVYKVSVIIGQDDDLDILAKDLLPQYIADVYGVSKRAASIKLKKKRFYRHGINLM